MDGLLYVVGGWSGCSPVPDCEVYDPIKQTWTSIAPLNEGKHSWT